MVGNAVFVQQTKLFLETWRAPDHGRLNTTGRQTQVKTTFLIIDECMNEWMNGWMDEWVYWGAGKWEIKKY